MKKIHLFLIACVVTITSQAQNPTTYFMEGTPLRSQWNPALTPDRGYINVPILGSWQIGTEGNISLSSVLYPKPEGGFATILSGVVPEAVALSHLKSMNRLAVGVNMNLIGFGSHTKKRNHYWAFDLNLKTNADSRFPYGLFDFIKNGNSADIANLGVTVESYAEAAFTYAFPITDKLYVGARAKALVGIARAKVNFDQFDAYLGEDRWYAHANGSIAISGTIPSIDILEDGRQIYDTSDLGDDILIPAGYGFGLDLGATYQVLPELTLSAAINDLGALFWDKKSTARGVVDRELVFEGIKMDENGETIQPEFDLDELEFEVQENDGVSQMLRTSIVLGGEYDLLGNKIGVGVFYQVKFWEYKTRHNITGSFNFRPLSWLHLSTSYSIIDNKANAIGFALNLCPSFINFFIGTDVLLSKKTTEYIPIKQSNMNVTFGLSFPIGPIAQR